MSAQSSALQRIQIASMREKLKLDKAKARQAEADAPLDGTLGPNGRPRVRYEDMPELHPDDEDRLTAKFNRLACPHAAVLQYRDQYSDREWTREHADELWWFQTKGLSILSALQFMLNGPHKDALEAAFADEAPDIRRAFAELNMYLIFTKDAELQAAKARGIDLEASKARDREEKAKIWEGLKEKFIAYASKLSED
jgi:hypothetical protein